jgi:hypothetical protein
MRNSRRSVECCSARRYQASPGDSVFLPDARRLADQYPAARFAVVPKGYSEAMPELTRPPCVGSNTLRILFVGTSGYLPNVDAATFPCREVLAVLRRMAGCALSRDREAPLHGFVEDLGPLLNVVYRTRT